MKTRPLLIVPTDKESATIAMRTAVDATSHAHDGRVVAACVSIVRPR